jgi:conserved oligomeric Golgi complex subunit 2
LKNLREKSQQSSSTGGEKQMMSDDDKIRLQLQIDILYYINFIESQQFSRGEIDSLLTLLNLIGDVTKIKLST